MVQEHSTDTIVPGAVSEYKDEEQPANRQERERNREQDDETVERR